MTPDELKTMPKDTFIVTRTGVKPMKTKLHLFFEWGIELNEKYPLREAVVRKVVYANKKTIEKVILKKYGEEVMNITTEENENLPLKAGIKDILRNMKE